MKIYSALKGLTLVAGLVFIGPASATIVITDPTDNDPLELINPICGVGDVTLGESDADACAGYYNQKDNDYNYTKNDAGEQALLNYVTDGTDWSLVYKVEDGNPTGNNTFDGIKITLKEVGITRNPGAWTIEWEDTNGADDLNLPVSLDLAAVFKAADSIGIFMFEAEILGDGPTYQRIGAFELQIQNNKGKLQGLSHEALYLRNLTTSTGPGPSPTPSVPEPAPLALIGLGGLLLGWMSRKSRA